MLRPLAFIFSVIITTLPAQEDDKLAQLRKLQLKTTELEKQLQEWKDKAAATSPKEDPKPAPGKPPKDESVTTQHTVTCMGQQLKYSATAATLTLTKTYGEPKATVFHVSYIKEDSATTTPRPVCFCFNGGPGSSAVWLHLGAFGPQRVHLPPDGTTQPTPPFSLTPNEYSLLATTDLVFVDPVSTGYSLPEKGEDAKQFHGFKEDLDSLGEFIRLWLGRHDRWTSQKFLMGESYGALRVTGLAEHLQDRYGMNLNGIIIVSGLLDFKTLSPDSQNDVGWIAYLPSYTAVAHHHQKLSPELQADFTSTWARAQTFARGDYARALQLGSSLTPAEQDTTATTLAALTSLPKDWILRQNLRISPEAFRQKLLEKEDLRVGRFDGRCHGLSSDPSFSAVFGPFSTLMNTWLRDAKGLNYRVDRVYEILNSRVQPWNYGVNGSYFDVCDSLTSALSDNPALRILITCGYHDLATPPEGIEYSIRHLDLPASLRANISWRYYPGGHMMYTRLDSLRQLTTDVTAFIEQKPQ